MYTKIQIGVGRSCSEFKARLMLEHKLKLEARAFREWEIYN